VNDPAVTAFAKLRRRESEMLHVMWQKMAGRGKKQREAPGENQGHGRKAEEGTSVANQRGEKPAVVVIRESVHGASGASTRSILGGISAVTLKRSGLVPDRRRAFTARHPRP
jgi:hypothetical protein